MTNNISHVGTRQDTGRNDGVDSDNLIQTQLSLPPHQSERRL